MSRKPQYNHVRITLTPTPPPPKTWTTPTYHLERFTIRRNVKTVNVQLHGLRGNEKRTESISFPLLPNVTDAQLVRAAVFCSPNKWTVPFGMNASQFQGNFSRPLDTRLLNAPISPEQAHSERILPQPEPLPNDQPTLPDVSFSRQQQFPFPPPQPGQFQPLPSNTPQPAMCARGNRRGVWRWYKTRTRKMQVALGCATVIAVVLFFSIVIAAASSGNTAAPPATATPAQQAVIPANTPTPLPTPTHPAPTPTPKPTVKPAPTVIVRPTPTPIPPKPTPTPSCQAVNGNPWCYNFTSPGRLIYYPPASFCSYFNCIPSFQESDDPGDGYIVQCADGMYSQSGGERGACSYHGGVSRPLYAH